MVTILYRPNSEHEREVLEFQHELARNQVVTKMVNVDSREGTSLALLYDITNYPAVVSTKDDGGLLNSWSGKLPQISEVTFTAHQ